MAHVLGQVDDVAGSRVGGDAALELGDRVAGHSFVQLFLEVLGNNGLRDALSLTSSFLPMSRTGKPSCRVNTLHPT